MSVFGKISAPQDEEEEVKLFYEREQKLRNVNLILDENQKAKLLQSDVWKMCRIIEGVKHRLAVTRVYYCDEQEWDYRFQGCLFLVEVMDGCRFVLVDVDKMEVVWTHKLFLGFEMEQRDEHFVTITDEEPDVVWGISFARLYPCRVFMEETASLIKRKCQPKKKEGGGIFNSVVSFFKGGAGHISNAMSTPPPPTAPPVQVRESIKEEERDTKWMMNMIEEAGFKKEELVKDDDSRSRVQEYFSAYENQEEGKSMFESIINIPQIEDDEVAYPDLDGLNSLLDEEVELPKPQQPEPYVPQQQQQTYHQPVVPVVEEQKPRRLHPSDEQGIRYEQEKKRKELEKRAKSLDKKKGIEYRRRRRQIGQLKKWIIEMSEVEEQNRDYLKIAKYREKLLMLILEDQAARGKKVSGKRRSRYNVRSGLVGRNTFEEDRM